ncbi:unnamed protein product [Mytilus edulis]|uniref:CCHC-type domain-containing protein n=1 Tax=Mytilus edulis TaxID=6550 RepID=A0A8S3SAH8_MYTED|nr:unnamed protein product [Mytilus edulis]
MTASGVSEGAQKRALLLHLIGQDAQDIFETFTETGDTFEDAVAKFDQYFLPKKNQPVERHVFRKCKQNENESIDNYVTRLKNLAKTCDFGIMLNDAIRDQVVDMCYSTKLRRRLLREKDLTLEKVQDIARASEAADQHSAQFEEVHINRVQVKRDFNPARHQRHDYNNHSKRKDIECHRCGRTGHIARECTIAMDKTCHKCGKKGHFAKKCKSKKTTKEQGTFYKKEKVRYMEEESSDDSEEYVFAIDRSSEKRITLKIGDVVIPFLVDSGATCNIINSEIMSKLKKCGVNKIPIQKQLYAYGAINPLMINSKIRSDITCEESRKCVKADFMVIEGNHTPLLGRSTASELGILLIGPSVNMINTQGDIRLSQVRDETTGRNIAEEYAYFVAKNAVPNAMTFKMIKDSAHLDKDIKQILNGKISKSNNLFRFREELSVIDGVLLKGSRIVIPDKLRKQTLQLAHEGHQGIVKTKLRLREKVWWPGIDQDAENLVKSCRACQVVGPVPKQEPIKRTQLPDGPWQDLCADLMGPFPTGEYVKIRTKLPEINAENEKDDADTRRKDFEMKEKGKIYADQKRKTRESDIDVGDIVLQKQTKTNKLSTTFEHDPYYVVKREGSRLTLKNNEGTISQRNSSFVKKFNGQINEEETLVNENIDTNIEETNENEHTDPEVNLREDSLIPSRPKRNQKLPERFKDFVMN